MVDIAVFGDGRVGRLLAERIRGAADGWRVTNVGLQGWHAAVEQGPDIAVLSVTHGWEATEIVRALAVRGATRLIVDLTTQSCANAEESSAASQATGMRYVAGGLTGGVAGLHAGAAVLLLGGPGLLAEEKARLAGCGVILDFPTARQGVAAKLLHNWYLLASSSALAAAAAVAESCGMSPGALVAAIHTGPAGRPVPHHSLVRDWLNPPSTSYEARLLLKDLPSIRELFEEAGCSPAVTELLDQTCGDLERADPGTGFTTALLTAAGVQPVEPIDDRAEIAPAD